MKRNVLLTLVASLALIFTVTVLAKDFSGTFSVTGGSPQRLSTILAANGYTGDGAIMQLDLLTICNPSANANHLYVGQSNVSSTNGYDLAPGVCNTWPPGTRPTDASQVWLLTATTQSEMISLRSR